MVPLLSAPGADAAPFAPGVAGISMSQSPIPAFPQFLRAGTLRHHATRILLSLRPAAAALPIQNPSPSLDPVVAREPHQEWRPPRGIASGGYPSFHDGPGSRLPRDDEARYRMQPLRETFRASARLEQKCPAPLRR